MAWRSTPGRLIASSCSTVTGPPGSSWSTCTRGADLLAGKPLSRTHIQRMATRRGLRRPAGFLSQVRSKRARERNKPPVIVPATPKPEPAIERPRSPLQRDSACWAGRHVNPGASQGGVNVEC